MMENKLSDNINKITQEAIEMFQKTTDRLFLERVEKEHKLAKQYSGREILELLQNIDDAYDPSYNHPCEASFELNENCLIVSNYGKPFTMETLQRLCQGNVSSKEGKYIGCKGIGFRSVLNWSDKIEIYSQSGDSDYIAVQFSDEYAAETYNKIRANEHIKSQVNELERKKIASTFPIFKAPKPIEPIEKKYDTVIKIHIKDKIKGEILGSIKNFDKYSLLFLPNIQKITFNSKSNVTTYSKEISNETVTIKCNNNEGESFYYFEDNGQTIEANNNGTNSIRMAVAIPVEATDTKYYLYTFFPILNIRSPFNALLHATFSLNANRNNFESSNEDDRINKAIFLKLLEFYISKVESLDLKERRLQLLNPKNFNYVYSFPDDLARLKCNNDYLELCKKKNVFYSINDAYLNAEGGENAPILINSSIPDVIKNSKSNFSRLVVVDDTEKPFAEKLFKKAVNAEDYLFEAINICSQNWTSANRISLFKWWNANRFTKLPNLIKNSKEEFINSSETACFLSGSITDIPQWANINIVNAEDENELLRQYEQEIENRRQNQTENPKRILPRIFKDSPIINLQEQSSRQVMISPVNNSVGSANEKAIDYIKWLWDVWKQEEKFDSTIKEKVDFVVPTKNNSVNKAGKTYIGADFYGNELGEKLFAQQSFEEVFRPNFIQDNEKRKFIRFLYDIGVSKFPKISSTKLENISLDYINHIKAKHAFECDYEINYWNVRVMFNTSINSILYNVDTKTILHWILADNQIKTQILLDEEPETSYAEYKPRISGKIYCDRWNNGWNLPSYIRYIFSTKNWIELNGKRYAPSQLMISSDPNIMGINCITEEYIENLANDIGINYEELKQILQKLGVKESYLDLDSSQFYGLLIQLGETTDEKSKKISREIYRAVINNNRGTKAIKTDFYSDSQKKQEFLQSGKVLAKNQKGDVDFKTITNVYFSSSAVLNLGNTYFIDIPPRSGNKDNFKEIFGIKPYEQDYSIGDLSISQLNNDFLADFKNYLPYLLTYRSGNKTSVSLDIRLVSEINVIIDNNENKIDTLYSLLKESKSKWYIYVGNNIPSYDKINKCKVAEALEQVFNVYFNFPAKDFLIQAVRLFICTPEQRKYFVESDFGSNFEYQSTLEDMSKAEELRQKIKDEIVVNAQNQNDLNSLVDEIDWMDLENATVQEKIVSLLRQAEKDIENLSKVLDREVSIASYIKKALWNEYCLRQDQIKVDIYYHCKNAQKYTDLITLWDEFESTVKSFTSNDLNFDKQNCLEQIINDFYQKYSIQSPQNISFSNIKQQYDTNKDWLIRKFQKDNINLNDFTNEIKNHSLLYFERTVWEYGVNSFVKKCKREDEEENKSEHNASESVSDILDQIQISNELDSGKARIPNGGHTRGAVTERGTVKKNKVSKRQGNEAEYKVILALAEKKISEVNTFFNNEDYSIIWKSGAANEVLKAAGDNYEYDTSQVDDGAGYDIELVNKSNPNKKICIEVKSSSSNDCSFFMSVNEYKKAQEIETNGGTYRVVFVSNIDKENTTISFIDGTVKDVFDAYPTEYNVVYNKEKLQE